MGSKNARNIKVVIIEDELHNSRMLKDMVEKLRPEWEIEAVLESVEESVNWLNQHSCPDLLLVDIQLSDGISFSIFKQVELETSTNIIFTTAYDEYAIRAFKVNSIDYLLKPIKIEDLENAFIKFEKIHPERNTSFQNSFIEKEQLKELVESIINGKMEYRKRFLISGFNSYSRLETKSIAYIYSSNKLTFAVTHDKKEYTLEYSLEQLEQELDPEHFFRANRKVIVNINAINNIKNEMAGKLILITAPETEFEITISRLKATEFKNWLGK